MLYSKFVYLHVVVFFFQIFLLLYILARENKCPENKSSLEESPKKRDDEKPQHLLKPGHKLAILVPFRDRFNELLQFVPYMASFLNFQSVNHEIYVLNQIDNFRFNRASLMNVGFKYAKPECDYMAMHDVDLLPLNKQLQYSYPKSGVYHISSPDLHPRYHYPTFVGGILLIKREAFEQVNGMSNKYWGWGLEDDEFYVRLKDANINIARPVNITTGKENTFRHFHDRNVRKRDMQKCFNQREVTRKRDHVTGLHDVSYKIQSIQQMIIDGAPVTIVNIQLLCDRSVTPWCTCDPMKQNLTVISAKKDN